MRAPFAITLAVAASIVLGSTARADDTPDAGVASPAHASTAPASGRAPAEAERGDEDADEAPLVMPPENTDDGRAPRRAVPDYDGREDPPASPEDIALWVPRVLFAPLRYFFQFVMRDALGLLLTTAEREHWDFVQLLPFAQIRPTWGIAPTVLIDFGFLPSVGVYLWANGWGLPHNHLIAQFGFGGPEWLRGTLVDRQPLSREVSIELVAQAWMRPDNLYYGLGPFATNDRASRFQRRRVEGELAFVVRPWRASSVRVSAGLSGNELADSTYLNDDELTLTDAVRTGWFNGLPAGWPGYSMYRQRIDLAVDSREPEPHEPGGVRIGGYTAGGVRAGVYAEHAVDLSVPLQRQWVLWGGGVGGFIDIDRGRGILLYTMVRLANALGSLDVPFTELPDFGWDMRMPGYWPGWLRGESATLTAIEYRYPIAPGIAGSVTIATGNGFRTMFDQFTFGRLRMGYGIGFRTVGDPDNSLILTLGLGTETFDNGAEITTWRIVLGNLPGF